MGFTDPAAGRHFAEDSPRGRDASMDIEPDNVTHRLLRHPRRAKHPDGIAIELIRHLRTDPMREEVRALEASKRRVDERRDAGLPAMAAAPAAVPVA